MSPPTTPYSSLFIIGSHRGEKERKSYCIADVLTQSKCFWFAVQSAASGRTPAGVSVIVSAVAVALSAAALLA